MTTVALPHSRDTLAAQSGFSLLADFSGAVQVLRNLSGLGRRSWLDRAFSPRAVAHRIGLAATDGETLTVEVSGAGRPLLLIHGLGGSHHDWDAAIASLAGTHRVYTFDLRGHGGRAAARGRPTLEAMARDVALVIDKLSLDRPLLVGHSMGALVLMQYLREHGSAKLSGLCFIDQSPCITTDAQWKLGLFGTLTREELHNALTQLRRDFVETVISEALTQLERFGDAGRGLLGRSLRRLLARLRDMVGVAPLLSLLESLADSDFRDVISRIPLPTLVLLGGASHHYGGLPLADYYLRTLARGTVITYEACAHSPHRQAPLDFANDLMDFAARHCA